MKDNRTISTLAAIEPYKMDIEFNNIEITTSHYPNRGCYVQYIRPVRVEGNSVQSIFLGASVWMSGIRVKVERTSRYSRKTLEQMHQKLTSMIPDIVKSWNNKDEEQIKNIA